MFRNPTPGRNNKQGLLPSFGGLFVSWKAGRIFSKNGTRGRWYYWNGSKKVKVWKSLKAGKPPNRRRGY